MEALAPRPCASADFTKRGAGAITKYGKRIEHGQAGVSAAIREPLKEEERYEEAIGKDEIRVIKLSREAITEMLWESFMEMYHDRLDIPNDDYHVCHMTLNEDMSSDLLHCYSSSTQRPDFEAIDTFLQTEAVGAADSIYTDLKPHKYSALRFADGFRKMPPKGSPPADDGL